jgi:segregation and condensation protein A
MKQELQIQNFDGPLDLLLQLIENRELDITTIALSEVTEQFISYLETIEERSPEELADFLVIATRLLLLKSQALLPYLQQEEEADPNELATQLKMYKRYVDAMEGVQQMLDAGRQLFGSKPSVREQVVTFRPPSVFELNDLRNLFVDVLESLAPIVRIPKAAIEKVVTLREKFTQIHDLLKKHKQLSFTELLSDSEDRSEVVVTFLALLELMKKQEIAVTQESPQDTITIQSLLQ